MEDSQIDRFLNLDTTITFLVFIALALVNLFFIHFSTKSCKMDRNKNILVTLNTFFLIINLFILVGLVILMLISNYCIGP